MAKPKKDLLEEIVEAIHPDKVTEKVTAPQRAIRGKWKIEKPKVENFEEFKKQLVGYLKHHWKEFYNADLSDDDAFGKAHGILQSAYQRKGGFEHAYDLAMEGRLDEVINELSSHYEQEAHNNYIAEHLHGKVDPTDAKAQTELAKRVLDKLKVLVPGKKFKNPEYYAKDYANLVSMYNEVVNKVIAKYTKKDEHDDRPGHH